MMSDRERAERLCMLEIVLTSPVLIQMVATQNRLAAPGVMAYDVNIDKAFSISGDLWREFDGRITELETARAINDKGSHSS